LTSLSLCYLVYIAWQIATATDTPNRNEKVRMVGFGDGTIIQLFNPKAYIVALVLFSGFPFLFASLPVETLAKLLIINAIFIPAYTMWLLVGVKLYTLNLSPNITRKINVALALSMLLAVAFSSISITQF
jgi:threonine/homoserine/homoserine lactone efflux protein